MTNFFDLPNFKYRHLITPKPKNNKEKSKNLSSMNWAMRLKRVFGMDIEVCPECGGKLKVISSIEEREVIKKILTHWGWIQKFLNPVFQEVLLKKRKVSIFPELDNPDRKSIFPVTDSLIQKFTFPAEPDLES